MQMGHCGPELRMRWKTFDPHVAKAREANAMYLSYGSDRIGSLAEYFSSRSTHTSECASQLGKALSPDPADGLHPFELPIPLNYPRQRGRTRARVLRRFVRQFCEPQ
jgi:hypothetical protein